MDPKQLKGYVDKLLLKLYDKNGKILNDIKNQNITFDTLLLAQRDNVLTEALELGYIVDENPDVLTYIENYRTRDYLYIGSIDLGIERKDNTSQFEIAALAGSLTTYCFNRMAIYGNNNKMFKIISDILVKEKSILEASVSIPKGKVKELIKQKLEFSHDSKQSNFFLKKSKELIFVYARYAILNLLNDVIIRASKNTETDIFTGMKNAVSPVGVLNEMISEKLLEYLAEILPSETDKKNLSEYLIASFNKEDVKNSLKISGKSLYNNLRQLISAYPIYTTSALKEQVTVVASEVVPKVLENIVEGANIDTSNVPNIYDIMYYINMDNPEIDNLVCTDYIPSLPEHTYYTAATSIPNQEAYTSSVIKSIDVVMPGVLSLILMKFVSHSTKFVRDKFTNVSKVKLIQDKTEDSVSSLKERLNSLIEKEGNEIKNKNISNLIKKLESLEGKDQDTEEYKKSFEKISKLAELIIKKRNSEVSQSK